jgi:GNAT superfamily N-acetyltransferase
MESVMNASTPPLIVSIKANLFEYYAYLGRSPRAEWRDDLELTWLLTGISHPFLNNVLRTRLASNQVDERITQTLAYCQSKGVTRLSWWAEPDTCPPELGRHLVAHGLICTSGGPGMAADLLALNEAVASPPDLTIERVQDAETLNQWVQAAVAGFELAEASAQACFDLFMGLGFDLPLRNYVGLLKGKPVATTELFLGAGVAGIYWVSTVPEARRQGAAAVMTLAPLREARDMGYRVGILHASDMGFGVYRRLGFQKHCDMEHFYWASATSQA